MRTVLIGLLGSVGALARFELARTIQRRSLSGERTTMLINIAGALALGLIVGIDRRTEIYPDLLAGLTVGFLGGFTTFSTWMIDVIGLAEPGESGRKAALFNLAVTLAFGLVGYAIGVWLASLA